MSEKEIFEVEVSADSKTVSRRVAIFPQNTPVKYEQERKPEKLVMTFPNLIIREVICFQAVVIVLVIISLLFDAPLEELANPQNTPNPAKAPWYFLGLQELLHVFPPVVAGVLIPFCVILALVVIPYFEINIKREGLWKGDQKKTFIVFSSVTFALVVVLSFFEVFAISIPTLIVYAFAVSPYFAKKDSRFINWLSKLSLAHWIMSWFTIVSLILIFIGTYFRGPGWSWVWPW
jgi:hypothetical protein